MNWVPQYFYNPPQARIDPSESIMRTPQNDPPNTPQPGVKIQLFRNVFWPILRDSEASAKPLILTNFDPRIDPPARGTSVHTFCTFCTFSGFCRIVKFLHAGTHMSPTKNANFLHTLSVLCIVGFGELRIALKIRGDWWKVWRRTRQTSSAKTTLSRNVFSIDESISWKRKSNGGVFTSWIRTRVEHVRWWSSRKIERMRATSADSQSGERQMPVSK
jgi:hypothetical protein